MKKNDIKTCDSLVKNRTKFLLDENQPMKYYSI